VKNEDLTLAGIAKLIGNVIEWLRDKKSVRPLETTFKLDGYQND
jgi:hypothetical protein